MLLSVTLFSVINKKKVKLLFHIVLVVFASGCQSSVGFGL